MSTYDLVIRNGVVVDGTGAPPVAADVAVSGDRIVAIGEIDGAATRTIDAKGRYVTPGFVDIHSHMDAQVFWDAACISSCWHGVTSVALGNCGVTFAPVRPGDHTDLAELMESVEDIPASSIMSGLHWNWETYGEFYDALDALPKGINVGGMVGHCALRYYAMGERSTDVSEHPTPADLEVMANLVDEAMAAGALGFSTSRTLSHTTPDGSNVPGTFAELDELLAITEPLGARRRGVVELIPRFETDTAGEWPQARAEVDLMAEISRNSGRPLTFSIFQDPNLPEQYRTIMELAREANSAGAQVRPQSAPRGIGVLFGALARSPFDRNPAWRTMRGLEVDEKLRIYADLERRAELIAQATENGPFAEDLSRHYVIEGPSPDYRPDPERALPAVATRRGVSLAEAYMDVMLESEGRAILNYPILSPDFDAIEEMISEPMVILGLADSGAHAGQIMDVSQPTWLLSHWVRDRELFSIEEGIRRLTSDPAQFLGIEGRGVLAPGAYADINVIDLEGMSLDMPRTVNDFPGGAARLIQTTSGYDYTIVNGEVFMESGQHTGALAGALLRSGPDER